MFRVLTLVLPELSTGTYNYSTNTNLSSKTDSQTQVTCNNNQTSDERAWKYIIGPTWKLETSHELGPQFINLIIWNTIMWHTKSSVLSQLHTMLKSDIWRKHYKCQTVNVKQYIHWSPSCNSFIVRLCICLTVNLHFILLSVRWQKVWLRLINKSCQWQAVDCLTHHMLLSRTLCKHCIASQR